MSYAKISDLLSQRYGEAGRTAAGELAKWIAGDVPYAYPEILEKHLEEQHVELLFDAFWQVLPFGTGGRRGRVGYGSNRLNPTTVAMTVQGHCQYLRTAFADRKDPTVVVANDVRVFRDIAGVYGFLGDQHPLLGVSSRSLAKLACEIYAGHGITAYFAQPKQEHAVLTTPELSFLIGRLGAIGGINLSASHNPPDDNGIKVYDQYGSQPVAPHDQQLVDIMNQATKIESLEFDQALRAGLIREIPAELHSEYIDLYVNLYDSIFEPRPDIPIVYTPLCGCGLTTVGDLLSRLGFPTVVPEGQEPDGSFSTIPFKAPNPEVPQATEPSKAFAETRGADVVLSSDPDADRVGLEVRRPDGSWYHFDGNQIAAVLCYYLMLDPEGPRRKGLVIETLVTTRLVGAIVRKAGESWLVDDLLVGFKYIADVLKELGMPPSRRNPRYADIPCGPEQLVIAVEESHGAMMAPSIRDKDAAPACMYLAALHQRLRGRRQSLLDYYIRILEEMGGFYDVNRSIMMNGAEGVEARDRMMTSLRESPPTAMAGRRVVKIVDYWDQETFGAFVSETDKLPRNTIQVVTEGFAVTIRPSGTEPKLKFYCQLLPGSGSSSEQTSEKGLALLRRVRERAEDVARAVYNELLARIDVSLDEAALMLPDIVDMDRKLSFERNTAPRLRESLEQNAFSNIDQLLAWLRDQTAAMTPGANPLPALKAPLSYLCKIWAESLSSKPLLRELTEWAKQA